MRTRRLVDFIGSLLLVTALVTIPSPDTALAWSNGGYSSDPSNPDYGTHDYIADMALSMQVMDVTFLTTTFRSRYLLGTEAPDNPDIIGDSSYHHVYYRSDGTIQDDRSAVRASQMYATALECMVTGDHYGASYYIGAMTHYIADMGVFGHTMGVATDWGAETHHSDYEKETEIRIGHEGSSGGTTLRDEDAYEATVGLAKDITFGQGAIRSNIWMDSNYNWSNPIFAASAQASLNRSIAAVASAINHLMAEKTLAPPPPQEEPPPPSSTQPQVPLPPSSLTCSVADSDVVLTWSAPVSDGGSKITGYIIFRRGDSEHDIDSTTISGDTLTWIDETVERGKTYSYWLLAENSVGRSNMSQMVSVTVPEATIALEWPWIVIAAVAAALSAAGAIVLRGRARIRPPS